MSDADDSEDAQQRDEKEVAVAAERQDGFGLHALRGRARLGEDLENGRVKRHLHSSA